MNIDLKIAKELFVTGHSGGSPWEIILFSTIQPALFFLSLNLSLRTSGKPFLQFFCEYFPVFVCVILYNYADSIFPRILFLCVWIAVIFVIFIQRNSFLRKDSRFMISQHLNAPFKTFISEFRVGLMLHTVLAILAVDFPAFPRRLAKTETYGTSLMDVGVGSFVFSLGLSFGIRSSLRQSGYFEIKSPKPFARRFFGIFLGVVRSSILTIVLGLIRLFLVKISGYQEHVSEYGQHWNFFFTLFFLSLVTQLLFPPKTPSWVLISAATITTTLYQFFLGRGLGSELIDHPRSSLFWANREGVCSLAGYISLYLIGRFAGILLKGSRSFANWVKINLATYSISFLFLALYYSSVHFFLLTPSRRMANAPYVVFTLGTIFMTLSLHLSCSLFSSPPKSKSSTRLIQGINTNSMIFFLLANLFTGAVNFLCNTLESSQETSFFVLLLYSLILCMIFFRFSYMKIPIKM